MPSGVQIPPGMEIKIGDKESRKVGYSICMPDHCEALLPLEETLVKSLAAAPTTEVTIRAVNGAEAKFTVNMKGFARPWRTSASRAGRPPCPFRARFERFQGSAAAFPGKLRPCLFRIISAGPRRSRRKDPKRLGVHAN